MKTNRRTLTARAHMLQFSPTGSHAVLAYVATGHVLFIDTATRAPVACIDVGVQAHAAMSSSDGRFVVVANRARLFAVAPIANPAPAGFDCPMRGDDSPGSITNQADVHAIAVRPK